MAEPTEGSFRFVICVDVNRCDLREAYKELYLMMGQRPDADCIDWESTDEVYDPEGKAVPESEITEARMSVFAEYGDTYA